MSTGPATTFFHGVSVRFSDTDRTLRATPMAMYGFMQEAAISHSESVGMGAGDLAAQNYAWMLNRVHLRYEDYPMWRDDLAIETWVTQLDGLYAIREFVMRDSEGNELATGTSRWVLIDMEKERPVRIPSSLGQRYGQCDRRAIADSFPRHKAVEHAEVSREFHVRLSDLDPNEHANSACYFDWCVETVPEAIHRSCRLASLQISYRAQSLHGDNLLVQGQTTRDTAMDATYIHTIHNVTRRTVAAHGVSH
jgi:acyl-CoA thioesterase FadM